MRNWSQLREDAAVARAYRKGIEDGAEAGHADRLLGIRSDLYWPGQNCLPSWYDQGYNNGYVLATRRP